VDPPAPLALPPRLGKSFPTPQERGGLGVAIGWGELNNKLIDSEGGGALMS